MTNDHDYGLQKLTKDILNIAQEEISNLHEECEEAWGITSPIEKIFFAALSQGCAHSYSFGLEALFCPCSGAVMEKQLRPFDLVIWPQYRVLDWPVDFLIGTMSCDGKRSFCVVECDGHEFHERTKEQAVRDRKRDRRLQAKGYRVFRFTGSEIYKDPLVPVQEIFDWASRLWYY